MVTDLKIIIKLWKLFKYFQSVFNENDLNQRSVSFSDYTVNNFSFDNITEAEVLEGIRCLKAKVSTEVHGIPPYFFEGYTY